MKHTALLRKVIYLALLYCCLFVTAGAYTNPVTGSNADPSILFHDGTYYLYATNGGYVYSSKNLVTWTRGSQVTPSGYKGIWAPDVSYCPEDGKFYMHFTHQYRLFVASADSPTSRFTVIRKVFNPAIDSHLWRDDDGKYYLYFTKTPEFQMMCMEMAGPAKKTDKLHSLFGPELSWEGKVNEGPWMVKRNGQYYLLYSSGVYFNPDYMIGCAQGSSPTGPFAKYPRPVMEDQAGGIWGPGHGSVEQDKTGTLWHLYHQKSEFKKGGNRTANLDPIFFDAAGKLSCTPTKNTEQTDPVTTASLVWAPHISPRGGTFISDSTITLTCRTAGASIYYTTDGSAPTDGSNLYRAPFILTKGPVTVKAKALKPGMTGSHISSQKFIVTI